MNSHRLASQARKAENARRRRAAKRPVSEVASSDEQTRGTQGCWGPCDDPDCVAKPLERRAAKQRNGRVAHDSRVKQFFDSFRSDSSSSDFLTSTSADPNLDDAMDEFFVRDNPEDESESYSGDEVKSSGDSSDDMQSEDGVADFENLPSWARERESNWDNSDNFVKQGDTEERVEGETAWDYRQRRNHRMMEDALERAEKHRTSQRTYSSSNISAKPLCFDCENEADIRCVNGCVPGTLFLCNQCDRSRHSGCITIHSRDLICPRTHGFTPAPFYPLMLQLSTCTICSSAIKGGNSCLDQSSIKTVTIQTTKGHMQARVVPVRCGNCSHVVGHDAGEYNCLDGAENIWFQNDVVENDMRYFVESNFSVTRITAAKVLASLNKERGCENKNRVIYDAFSRAHRINAALMFRQAQGGHVGRAATDVLACKACAEGYNGIHGDGCFKQRSLLSAGRAHGLPLMSLLGEHSFNADAGSLTNDELERFKLFRERLGIPATSTKSDDSACPDYRAVAMDLRPKRKMKISGLFLGVCPHGVSVSGLPLKSRGEGLNPHHYLTSKLMHASGQRPLEEVFGPVDATTEGPNLEAYRCDIVCIFKNNLKHYDPILPELVPMALNAIHKWTHSCIQQNDALNMEGTAFRNGENAEFYNSEMNGLAPAAEHMAEEKWVEAQSFAMHCTNQKAIAGLFDRLVRMSQRANEAFEKNVALLEGILDDYFRLYGAVVTPSDLIRWIDMLGMPQQENIDKLSPRAELCGKIEERDSIEAVLSALSDAIPFTDSTTEEERTKMTQRLKSVNAQIMKLQRMTGSEPPTEDERSQWRACERKSIMRRIGEGEAQIHFLNGSFARELGHNHYIHSGEKAVTRRKIDIQKKKVEMLRNKLAHPSFSTYETSATEENDIQDMCPYVTKAKIVTIFNTIQRCSEELEKQLPKELESIQKTCARDAELLNIKALELEEVASRSHKVTHHSRYLMGQATMLRVLAEECTLRSQSASSLRLACAPTVACDTLAATLISDFNVLKHGPIQSQVNVPLYIPKLEDGPTSSSAAATAPTSFLPLAPISQTYVHNSLCVTTRTTVSTNDVHELSDSETDGEKPRSLDGSAEAPAELSDTEREPNEDVRILGAVGNVQITMSTYRRLKPEKFVNEDLVDAAACHLLQTSMTMSGEIISQNNLKKSHIFSAFVFANAIRENFREIKFRGIDVPIRRAFDQVHLFSKRILLFPVSGNNHWSTLAVFHLDKLIEGDNDEEYLDASVIPCIVHFDSLRHFNIHDTELLSSVIRPLLVDVALLNHPTIAHEGVTTKLLHLPFVKASIPLQNDGYSCALHHMVHVEKCISIYPEICARDLVTSPPCSRYFTETMYSSDFAKEKRSELKAIIDKFISASASDQRSL